MEILGSVFLFIAFGLITYLFAGKIKSEQQLNPGLQSNVNMNDEISRRKEIVNKVDSFLKNSKFLEPIAKWHNENIYKYVFNGGYLYEFEDTMSPTNQKIGIDEECLCFKQLYYKRVNNPVEFIKAFSSEINPIV